MITVGVICEYNPFHNGHAKQFAQIRAAFVEDCRIVCLMSGNYVQRGEPAVFDKHTRAAAAIACGADVVLELPVIYAISSAEGFADGGVQILSALQIDYLCFGCESGNGDLLMKTAQMLLNPQMDESIKAFLQTGISYAAAREKALSSLYPDGVAVLQRPNDILAVEYCKAILHRRSPMKIFPVPRAGDYHAETAETENPSAAAIRAMLSDGQNIAPYLPPAAYECIVDATPHGMKYGARAIFARLNTMSEEDFSKLPYGSEGLWRRFMHACREAADIDTVIETTKTKRYARSRISRMLLCAALGLTAEDLARPLGYVRILAFSEQGRQVLRRMKATELPLVSATQKVRNSAFSEMEERCERMYSLFRR